MPRSVVLASFLQIYIAHQAGYNNNNNNNYSNYSNCCYDYMSQWLLLGLGCC